MDFFLSLPDPRRWTLSIGVVLVVLAAEPVRAGTVIDVKTVYFAGSRGDETATIYLDEGRVRVDAIEDGRATTLIFRLGDDGEPLCWVIDKESRAYVEFTRKSADRLHADGARALSEIEEQLGNASPARREQLRKTMDKQLQSIPGRAANAEFRRIASGVKLNRWTCTQYEGYIDGEKLEDLWTVEEKDIGLDAPQIRALREMGVFFAKFSAETNAFFHVGKPADQGGFRGFPVLVVAYKDGRKREKSEVNSIRREALDPSLFDLPQGARRQTVATQP